MSTWTDRKVIVTDEELTMIHLLGWERVTNVPAWRCWVQRDRGKYEPHASIDTVLKKCGLR